MPMADPEAKEGMHAAPFVRRMAYCMDVILSRPSQCMAAHSGNASTAAWHGPHDSARAATATMLMGCRMLAPLLLLLLRVMGGPMQLLMLHAQLGRDRGVLRGLHRGAERCWESAAIKFKLRFMV